MVNLRQLVLAFLQTYKQASSHLKCPKIKIPQSRNTCRSGREVYVENKFGLTHCKKNPAVTKWQSRWSVLEKCFLPPTSEKWRPASCFHKAGQGWMAPASDQFGAEIRWEALLLQKGCIFGKVAKSHWHTHTHTHTHAHTPPPPLHFGETNSSNFAQEGFPYTILREY